MMDKCVGCSLYNAQKTDIWKDIEGYGKEYRVSNKGEVQHRKENEKEWETKTTQMNKDGYYCVRLSKDGEIKQKYVHRLVAEAFIDNPENKETVDHINGDKSCNCVDNLRCGDPHMDV